ncbi:beta-ribofuranosylaminobenzene 5'-phosphate synthase family protein [Chelativorans sp. M5D2P16]|uniref:beta-ribofuranosylaminobenzene 5'-phosphate synthase family protein n=1 Tax=Chelativorans sp. M5D2P16 TaxID=3095678 RepID=UPI002ACA6AFD|nr:beta-ribofuranosylaminobenzene 5'-phosphate synthase family protein [Chelativorans sp. M5D2P16]MDZ5698697.1 beta-ribofuranosylaminobenzene 5'-phosphate synthase family protein [Chelativorans sp. M5D2P16]
MAVRVSAGSRIHIALADMGFASPRAFGGVGFMLDKIAADVELRCAPVVSLEGATDLDKPCQFELTALLETLAEAGKRPVRAIIHSHAIQHIGLGTKTALKLAVISAYHHLVELPGGRAEQQSLSGRGGASGIGIHGFFEGGVLWDAGRPAEEIDHLLPSGARPATSTPVLMLRLTFPTSWRVGLCLPKAELSHGLEEQRFFEENAPIAPGDALETMALLYHGILPAFRLENLKLLASSLASISCKGFKRLEIERCGENVVELLGDLRAKGYAASMSSMGPLVYVIFAASDTRAAAELRALCVAHNAHWLGCHSGLNCGARASRDKFA